jgi:hypothetical protein
MIVVVSGKYTPHKDDVLGIISKEHIADSVIESVRPYFGAGTAL